MMTEMKTTINIVWNGGKEGNGTLKAGYLDTNIAIPEELGGSGDGTDPKELLISSATTCYLTTLAYMLETRNIPVEELKIHSEATISNQGFYINHHPQIKVSADATEKQVQSAERAFDGADKSCDVGNLLKNGGVVIKVFGKVM